GSRRPLDDLGESFRYVRSKALARPKEERLTRGGRERRLLRRLPNDRVTAYDREAKVPSPDGHRKVERADHADDAERMPRLGHPVAGSLGCDRESVKLAREAASEVGNVDHLLHLTACLGDDLPSLERHEAAERVLLLP